MADIIFYLLAGLTVGAAIAMVLSRDTVNSAMLMILTFVGTAGLFVLLSAFFIAVLQVLVYAGAVMVLFLFIIMLLDIETPKRILQRNIFSGAIAVAALGVLAVAGIYLLKQLDPVPLEALPVSMGLPEEAKEPFHYTSAPKSLGYALFTKYLLPLQCIGFLLLTAMLGVILISKRMLSADCDNGDHGASGAINHRA